MTQCVPSCRDLYSPPSEQQLQRLGHGVAGDGGAVAVLAGARRDEPRGAPAQKEAEDDHRAPDAQQQPGRVREEARQGRVA